MAGGSGRRLRRVRWVAGGSRRSRGRAGSRRTRSARGSPRSILMTGWRVVVCAGVVGVAGRSPRPIPRCSRRLSGSLLRTAAAIRCRFFCGRPRACAISLPSYASRAMRCITRRWRRCCVRSATACSPIARRWRAPGIPTATRSFATSTTGSRRRSPRVLQRSRSTPRRRNSSASSPTAAASGGRPGSRSRSPRTTSPARRPARRSPTASTTSPPTRGSSTSGSRPRPRNSRSRRSRAWWEDLGRKRYPDATQLADHCRLRRRQRQPRAAVEDRATATGRPDRPSDPGLPLPARHQQVEQDRTSAVLPHQPELARTPAGQLRRSIINSIAATTTGAGLKVYARLDQRDYPKKVEVTDAQLAAVNITPDPFHPEWNYSISPTADHAG